ncbi:MAG: rhodanese-like domain-containing protein [Thiobacillaceae bacterium]
MCILNIAAYRFRPLDDLPALKRRLEDQARTLELKGTVLLAPEGINCFLSGLEENVHIWLASLQVDSRFAGLEVKRSFSDYVPYKRLRVRVKEEIISFRQQGYLTGDAPYVSPKELGAWLDAGREVVFIDTRNEVEFAAGSFEHALNPHIQCFTDFAAALDQFEHLKDKTVVAFCTGGIRCEKAVPFMRARGFSKVYQLQGGILNYFAECGGKLWRGNCFVFDERGALTPELNPVNTHVAA